MDTTGVCYSYSKCADLVYQIQPLVGNNMDSVNMAQGMVRHMGDSKDHNKDHYCHMDCMKLKDNKENKREDSLLRNYLRRSDCV